MHEEALLQDLLRKIEAVAGANGARRVGEVRLWVGALAHLSELQVRARWDLLTRGTVAEGARLGVELSHDLEDPRATGVVLVSLGIEEIVPRTEGPEDGRAPATFGRK